MSDHGWVRVMKGFRSHVRPFVEYREITKGKQKGCYEIMILGRKYIVYPKHIIKFPGEDTDKQVKKERSS